MVRDAVDCTVPGRLFHNEAVHRCVTQRDNPKEEA